MKRLLVLATLTLLVSSATGCRWWNNRGAAYTACPPTTVITDPCAVGTCSPCGTATVVPGAVPYSNP